MKKVCSRQAGTSPAEPWPKKSTITVLEGILCKAGIGLNLTGYNMETAISYQIDAEVAEAGECILPAKLFGDIVRQLPEGSVTVVVETKITRCPSGQDSRISISPPKAPRITRSCRT